MPDEGSHGAVIVVGGGLAGLAAATALAERGRNVTLIEATQRAGGRARSFDDATFGREIDNGQHLVMGCYREMEGFLRRIGQDKDAIRYQPNLGVEMLRPGGDVVSLRCPALPAPLHLAVGLLRMRGVGLLHRLSALRAGLMLRGEIARPDDNETCDAWLRRLGQTNTIRAVFWEPLIWAVLNDDPMVASAAMLMAVLDHAFMGSRHDARLGVPRLPLSRLYVDHALAYLRERGATVLLGAPVRGLDVDPNSGEIRGVTLRGGEQLAGPSVISALPPHALLDLLPDASRRNLVFEDVARLETSPIVSLWAQVDRPLFKGPFVGLVHSPLHWLFDRDQIEGPATRVSGTSGTSGTLLTATISGARAFVRDSSATLRELFVGELGRYFPGHPIEVRAFRAIKEKRATISHAAGSYERRPRAKSPIPGLLLAGDWVRTGLPATIESAVLSGHTAARAAR